MAAGLGSGDRRSLYARAVARGVANTHCSIEQERRYGALRLLANLRLPDLAVYGGLRHSQDGEGCAACFVAQALIAASSGAMRLAHRALEMHSRDVGHRVDAWLERALERARNELHQSKPAEGSPGTLDQARLVTLALTRAIASTANDPMLVPGQVADALTQLRTIYLIAIEIAAPA